MQPKNRARAQSISELILLTLLKTGAISLAVLGGSKKEGRAFLKEFDKFAKPHINRAVSRLCLSQYIKFDPTDKESPIVLTEKGWRRAKRCEIKLMAREQPKRWDHLWRVVIFDIPEKKKIRKTFSRELRNLGFYPLQRSVFVYPADCSKLIDEVCRLYHLEQHVLILLAGSLGRREEEVKRFFFADPR